MTRLTWIVAGVVALLCVTFVAEPAATLPLLTLALIVWFIASRGKSARADAGTLKTAACDAVGMPADSKFAHVERGTAIALNPQARRIAVSMKGESRVYGYDDVRSWDVRKVSRAGGAVGHGVAGTIDAGSQNIADSMAADRQTGLFLTVRDIDHAEWRISMFDPEDRARWAEILRQEFDDQRVQAPSR